MKSKCYERQVCTTSSHLHTVLTLHAVQRFAHDVVAPKVREMDENEMMDKDVIKGLFDQGVRTTKIYTRYSLIDYSYTAHGN